MCTHIAKNNFPVDKLPAAIVAWHVCPTITAAHVADADAGTAACFSSGQPVQQISVITALPDLLKENNADCMRRVVPKVRVSRASANLTSSTRVLRVSFNVSC